MASLPLDIRRVLVALSGAEDEWASLDAAIDLAVRLQAELTTLFIEDADLLRASLLPCVREIGRLSAQSRQMEFGQLERALKAAASTAELRLRQTAEARALRYSFQVLRGRPVPQLLNLAERLDVVLLAPPAWERRRQLASRPIAVFYDASTGAEQALALAAGLARDTGSPLHALIPAKDEAIFARQWAQARAHAPGLVLSGERCADPAALPDQVNRQDVSALVLHEASGFDAEAIDRLRSRLRCDVLLLR
ncbi:MAG: universal stress protein [Hydrogenophilaceae bacterium]|nr:universal stress protein [Hydrogenophilaceae bacterium]